MAKLSRFAPARTCAISKPSKKLSESIHPRASTCRRIEAFCPPPNEVAAIVAKVSAMLPREGRASAGIRHRPVHDRAAVLARKNVNMHVLGVLVGRQHAHSNHESFFVQTERERDPLNSAQQAMPNLRVADREIQYRRDPFFRND